MKHSTKQVPLKCHYCGKWLKQSEEYCYTITCTECIYKILLNRGPNGK